MTPKEQLLLFTAASDGATDPIRIMKGLFIFTQRVKEGRLPPQPVFQFRADNFGPCAIGVYRDLDLLVEEGLIKKIPVPGETWSQYKITDAGKQAAARVETSNDENQFIHVVRDWCDSQNFASLLRAVYQAWPDYARNSVLPHLRPNG